MEKLNDLTAGLTAQGTASRRVPARPQAGQPQRGTPARREPARARGGEGPGAAADTSAAPGGTAAVSDRWEPLGARGPPPAPRAGFARGGEARARITETGAPLPPAPSLPALRLGRRRAPGERRSHGLPPSPPGAGDPQGGREQPPPARAFVPSAGARRLPRRRPPPRGETKEGAPRQPAGRDRHPQPPLRLARGHALTHRNNDERRYLVHPIPHGLSDPHASTAGGAVGGRLASCRRRVSVHGTVLAGGRLGTS